MKTIIPVLLLTGSAATPMHAPISQGQVTRGDVQLKGEIPDAKSSDAPSPSATNLLSPRLTLLQSELQAGKSALDAFWQEMKMRGAPLVEPISGDDRNSLVTFLWRAQGETRNVVVVFGGGDQLANSYYLEQGLMANLAGTDVWYRTFRFRNDARYTYSISPNDALSLTPALTPEERTKRVATLQQDPLNARTFDGRSVVELPDAPPQPWLVRSPHVPQGKVEEHKFRSSILQNERSIWVYTPPGYSAQGKPNCLLVAFDGGGSVGETAPVTLDNLIAQRRIAPTVAVLIGNAPGARIRELFHNDSFNEFLVKEVMPWVRKNYRVTTDPRHVVVAGNSLGGNAALFAGLRHPEVFGNVLEQSGGIMYRQTSADNNVPTNPGQFFEEGFPESSFLTLEFAQRPKMNLKFYIEAGLAEDISWQAPLPRFAFPSLLAATRHLRDVLRAKGYEVHYNEYNGAHEPLSWRGTYGDALIALIGTAAPGELGRR